jgi:hypothetical protein
VVHGPNPCTHRKPLPLSKSPPPRPPIFDSKAPFHFAKSPPPLLLSPLPPHFSPCPPFLPLSSPSLGGGRGGRGKSGGKGEGGSKFHSAPPFLRPALPHLWGRAAKFLPSVYITQPALPRDQKKPLGQHNFFSTTPNSNLFIFPQRYYIGPPSFKISDLCSCF